MLFERCAMKNSGHHAHAPRFKLPGAVFQELFGDFLKLDNVSHNSCLVLTSITGQQVKLFNNSRHCVSGYTTLLIELSVIPKC